MRTTLTLDDDVAAMLRRAKAQSPGSFKRLVNELLRAGLARQLPPKAPKPSYRMPVSDAKVLIPNVDNIEEVLEHLEGPWRR